MSSEPKKAEKRKAADNAAASERNEPPEATNDCPVAEFEVGTYKKLKAREESGDNLEHDHIPSFAAIRAAKEKELGRDLTKEEAVELRNNTCAIEVSKDLHRAGPTYKGKNTPEQIEEDAADLGAAARRDTDALLGNAIKSGRDPEEVKKAIDKLHEKNRDSGLYD